VKRKTPTRKGKRNPADEAAKGYEEFHGEPPKEFITFESRVHYHKDLSGAGELQYLRIIRLDGERDTIKGFGKDCLLTFNETKNQLFITGGDQRLENLAHFGIGVDSPVHEIETIGKVTKVGYFTDKKHLGDEGGEAIYDHGFRTTNEWGKHVTVRIKRYPDLIYRVRDEQLEFSGGSYEIRAEGIDY
jgi:hypothetical protein